MSGEVNSQGYCDTSCGSNYSIDSDNYCFCSSGNTEVDNVCLGGGEVNQSGCNSSSCNEVSVYI